MATINMADPFTNDVAAEDLRRVFIASSAETMAADWFTDALSGAADAVRDKHPDVDLLLWEGAFDTGDVTASRLVELAGQVAGAVVVFAADDFTESRGEVRTAPRDNLLLEAGIFLSRLGLSRVLLLRERESKWPTNLLGVTAKEFTRPPGGRPGAKTILANDIAKSVRQFVDRLPCPRVDTEAQALSHSAKRLMGRADDLKRKLESPPVEIPITIADPLYAYLDALRQVETGFATTTYLDSSFWTSRDLDIIEANRRMLERIKQSNGTARRLILLDQSVGDELRTQRRRRRLLRSGEPEAIKQMNKEYEEFATANLDLIEQGFEVRVVHDRNSIYKRLPEGVFQPNDTELALYDASRVDKFSGFTSKERSRVEVYDANMFVNFEALRQQASTYFETLWKSNDATDFSSFASEMETLIDEIDREIDYAPNWLALYDRTDGDDGELKRDEARYVRKWLERRHGKLTEIVASHLDLGTGTGRYLKELSDCVIKDGTIVGIDIDPDCIKLVKLKQANGELGPAEIKDADLRRLDELPERQFDVITCMMGTLCHLPKSPEAGSPYEDDWQTGLGTISTLLAADGDAFVAVWDANGCRRGNSVLRIYDERSKAILCDQSPTLKELQARVKQAGLSIVQEALIQGRLRVLQLHPTTA